MRAILLMALFTLTLSGCGPSDSDIKKAGFSNAAEMKKANAEGYKTKDEAIAGEANKLGFENVGQMNRARSKGADNFEEYKQLSEKLGFSSAREMEDLTSQGYRSKVEYLRATNTVEALDVPSEFIDPPNTYWVGVASPSNSMDKSEPMTKCSEFIDYDKTGLYSQMLYRFDQKGYRWIHRTPKNSPMWKNPMMADIARSTDNQKFFFEIIRLDSRGDNQLKITFKNLKGYLLSETYIYESSRQVRYLTALDNEDYDHRVVVEMTRNKIKTKVEEGIPGLRQILCKQ